LDSSDGYQLYIRNDEDDINDWYIGASSAGWAVGDDHLVFGPSNSSTAAVLRLNDVTDNNGSVAPVVIASAGAQRLLLDGNEIDVNSALFINYNTNENTYINAAGGKAAVGSSSPWGQFHVQYNGSSTSAQVLTLETPRCAWGITTSNTVGNANLFFTPGGSTAVSGINSVNGAYLTFSDRRMKENIQKLPSLLDKVNSLNMYSYNIIDDEKQKQNIGVIAQELEKVFPELVNYLDDKYAVNYGRLSVVALKTIQELSSVNSHLSTTLEKQQAEIVSLRTAIEEIRSDR